MRNKTILFIVITISLVFSGCFSPWGSEQGTLTISVGGRSAAREAVSWLNNADSEDFLHILTLTGPGQKQEVRFIGSKSMTFTVITGLWNVTVKAYDLKGPTNYPDNLEQIDISRYNLIAEGSEDINVRGGNNSVKIQMKTPKSNDGSLWDGTYHIIVGVIPGQNGWLDHNNAKGTLTYGNVEVTSINGISKDLNDEQEYRPIDLRYMNGTDTVTIKAIPTPNKGFHFVKWVIVGNYIGQGGMDGTGEIINKAPLEININGKTIDADDNNMVDIKISDIVRPSDAGFNFYILAVFDGDGESAPKNITHAGTGDGGLRSMDMDKDYALMTDLELTGEWTPIGSNSAPFNGSFNGMGHTITYNNVVIESVINSTNNEEHAGLFGVMQVGTVKNLILKGSISNVNHTAGNSLFIGAVAGENRGSSIIKNVVSLVNIDSSVASTTGKIYAGGIAGKNSSLIENCAGVGAIGNNTSSIDYGGGIVGLISDGGRVYCCWASGEIDIKKDNGYAGGIAGNIAGTSIYTSNIRNCLAVNSRISNISSNTGRIVGDIQNPNCELSNNYAYIPAYTPTGPMHDNKEGANAGNSPTSVNNYNNPAWWTTDSNWYTYVKYWSKSISLNTTPNEDTPWIWSSSRYGINPNAPYLILWFSK